MSGASFRILYDSFRSSLSVLISFLAKIVKIGPINMPRTGSKHLTVSRWPYDNRGRMWPTFSDICLRVERKNPGKTSTRKLTRPTKEPRPAVSEATLLPLEHSGVFFSKRWGRYVAKVTDGALSTDCARKKFLLTFEQLECVSFVT